MNRYFHNNIRKFCASCVIFSALFFSACATDSDLNGQKNETTIVSLIRDAKSGELAEQNKETTIVSLIRDANEKKAAKKAAKESEKEADVALNQQVQNVQEDENQSVEEKNSKEALKAEKKAQKALKREKRRQEREAKKLAKQQEKEAKKKALEPEADFVTDPDGVIVLKDVETEEDSTTMEVASNVQTPDPVDSQLDFIPDTLDTIVQSGETDESEKNNRAIAEFEATGKEWYFSPAARKKVERNLGRIRISANGKKGTFNFSLYKHDEKPFYMLSKNREGTGSSFYLLYGNKVYKLTGSSAVKTAARSTEHGIQLSYLIPGKAHVLVDMDIISSSAKRENDMIKISASMKNLGAPKENDTDIVYDGEEILTPESPSEKMGLKLLLDTACAEKKAAHWTTSKGSEITTETQIHYGEDISWIQTGDDGFLYQIILTGGEVTPFDSVNIAGYESLGKLKWETPINPAKPFGTVSSYNDSAVSWTWKTEELEYGDEISVQTVIATGVSPEDPEGDTFIGLTKALPKTLSQTVFIDNKIVSNNSGTGKNANGKETLTELEYSDDYVQRLLERISELESGAKELKRDELLLLNQELDMILSYLRNE